MAQKTDCEESKTNEIPPVVNDLSDLAQQTKFKIDYKDKHQLIKDIHYVANHLFPLNNEPYNNDTDVSKSNYSLSVIKGGITNLLYLMTPKNIEMKSNDDNKANDAQKACKKLLVRVYGENTEVLIDRDREEKLFYELGNLAFGPQLYGIFGNGRIEQWYDNALTLQLHERKHCKKVCATLAEMHSTQPLLLKNESSQSLLWPTMDKWYNIASNIEFKDNSDKQKQYQQLNWLNIPKQMDIMQSFLPSNKNNNNVDKLFDFIIKQQADGTKKMVEQHLANKSNKIAFNFMFDFVFTHSDLLGGNILYLQDTKEIKFVDFEYGAYNFRAFDFANHFCEYAGFDCDWKKHFPEKQHIKEFVNDYISVLCNNDKYKMNVSQDVIHLFERKNGFDGNDYDVFLDSCCDVIVAFTCIDHYFWGLWGVVQSRHSPIQFDFIQYANDRLVSGYQYSLTLLPNYLKFVTANNEEK